MQVIVVTGEYLVLLEVYLDVQVARWATVDAMFAFANQTNAISLVNACRNFDRQGLVLLDPAGAATGFAWIWNITSGAMTFRAGLLNREETLLQTNLS
jgi:hypothetical protein